jgi:hypothetical protein
MARGEAEEGMSASRPFATRTSMLHSLSRRTFIIGNFAVVREIALVIS